MMGGISKKDFIESLNQASIIDEEEIYNAIMNRDYIVGDIISDFDCAHNILSSKHYSSYFTSSKGQNNCLDDDNHTDHPIRITYNKGKDNDQMLLTKIRQACAKKGYSITNANRWLGRLKKDGAIEI